MKYIVLLRGINVGGNKKVSMNVLERLFSNAGFSNTSTLLNTGNILLESQEKIAEVKSVVTELLEKNFDFDIASEVITENQLINFLGNKAVEKVIKKVDQGQKIIFTFAKDLSTIEINDLKTVDDIDLVYNDSSILCLHFSVDQVGTPFVMKSLDSALKKRGTSRNLNTVLKIKKRLETL